MSVFEPFLETIREQKKEFAREDPEPINQVEEEPKTQTQAQPNRELVLNELNNIQRQLIQLRNTI
ncbi:MAG: hypothetical protein DRN81_02035 [Thermoproteota archaeon]|nr:MAG: hypothetical protein DRN81_02035 [Candidatus Korarchaeota archaeon]